VSLRPPPDMVSLSAPRHQIGAPGIHQIIARPPAIVSLPSVTELRGTTRDDRTIVASMMSLPVPPSRLSFPGADDRIVVGVAVMTSFPPWP